MPFPGLQPGLLSAVAELNLRKGTNDGQKEPADIGPCVLQSLPFKSGLSLLRSFSQPCSCLNQESNLGAGEEAMGGPRGQRGFYQEGCARAVPSAVP